METKIQRFSADYAGFCAPATGNIKAHRPDLQKLKATSTNTLVFPAPRGGVEFHFLRILQDLGDKAGVTKVKCHRFRDTYITDKVHEGVDVLTLRKGVGHTNLKTLKLYPEVLRAKDQRARDAASRQDRYTLRAVAVAAD